jgi:hypothetical protein
LGFVFLCLVLAFFFRWTHQSNCVIFLSFLKIILSKTNTFFGLFNWKQRSALLLMTCHSLPTQSLTPSSCVQQLFCFVYGLGFWRGFTQSCTIFCQFHESRNKTRTIIIIKIKSSTEQRVCSFPVVTRKKRKLRAGFRTQFPLHAVSFLVLSWLIQAVHAFGVDYLPFYCLGYHSFSLFSALPCLQSLSNAD